MNFLSNNLFVDILESCVYSKLIKRNMDLTNIKLSLYKIIGSYVHSWQFKLNLIVVKLFCVQTWR